MSVSPFSDFDSFWPYYLREHSVPLNRTLHFIGTTLVLSAAVALVLSRDARWLLAMPVCGYGWAWVGHFAIQRNRPATFRHPLWSLRADFRMFGLMLVGRLAPELERAGVR